MNLSRVARDLLTSSAVDPKILIVEDDPWMQRELLAALDGRGYELMPASNGVTALARTCGTLPDLILSDVVMPVMDGWTLLKRVRHSPRLAGVPFMFLSAHSSPQDLQRAFRLGADDFVPKPFDVKDLAERIDHMLYRTAHTSGGFVRPSEVGAVTDKFGFTGSLGDISVTALLSFLDMERKTGMVILRNGEERGRVFVRDGRVISARLDRGPSLTNAEAIYWMLRWSAGKFEFRTLVIDMDDEVRCPTAFLVLEGARRLDEARQNAAATL